MYQVYHYPTCSTCKKAIKWLKENHIDFELLHITQETPSEKELMSMYLRSDLEIKKFFNTSGKVYRDNDIKSHLPTMSDEQAIRLLSNNGMLIKRPIIVSEDTVLVGFKQEQWEKRIKS